MQKELKKRSNRSKAKAHLRGEIVTKPTLLHEQNGQFFFFTTIKVISGEKEDEIKVMIPKEYAEGIKEGDLVEVKGDIMSYVTKNSNGKYFNSCVAVWKLRKVKTKSVEHLNELIVVGYIKKKEEKIVSTSISLAQMTLNVRGVDNITCTSWNIEVVDSISRLKKGCLVEVRGRFISKFLSDEILVNEIEVLNVTRR